MVRASRWDRGVAQMQAGGFADANASFADTNSTLTPTGGVAASSSFSSSNVVSERAATSAATRPGAAACGAPAS